MASSAPDYACGRNASVWVKIARACAFAGFFLLALRSGAVSADDEAARILRQLLADPAQQAGIIEEGRKAAFFCGNCHGENGNSRIPEVPNLAEQNPFYVLNQIQAFLSGRRKNEFMEGLMKVLNARKKATIAFYYANARVVPAGTPGDLSAKGAEHYARLCAHCHQADARGAETYPRLAGQQPEYLRSSLKRYLTQSGERTYPPMTAAITQLGGSNIDAMVAYLSSLE